MASSSKAQAATPGGSPMDKKKAPPMVTSEEEESETQSDFDLTPTSSSPLEEILAHPTLNPWYESGSLFPSIPADVQLPSADWEWLVKRKDATANAI